MGNDAYIAAAGYRKVDLFPAAIESKEVKTLQLQGNPKHLKNFRDSISLMVNKDVFHLIKYDGVNGLVVEATVKEKEPFNSYAFVKGYSGSSALAIANAEKDNYYLVLGNEVSTLKLYETSVLNHHRSKLGCRYPEIPDLAQKTDYCDISGQHTMCKFKNADPGCNIEEFSLSQELKDALVEEINKERRKIAREAVAENMRKIVWNDELARIAQIWAIQCTKELDYVRIAILDDGETSFSQNIARFEFNEEKINLDSVKSLVKFWVDSYDENVPAQISNYNHPRVATDLPPKQDYDLSYFTQLAWAETDRIGCGYARYKEDGKESSTSVFVCNFASEGNVQLQPVYSVGSQVCGNCGAGFICEDTLPDGSEGSLCVKA